VRRFAAISRTAGAVGFLNTHVFADGTLARLAAARTRQGEARNPFLIGADATRRYYGLLDECLSAAIARPHGRRDLVGLFPEMGDLQPGRHGGASRDRKSRSSHGKHGGHARPLARRRDAQAHGRLHRGHPGLRDPGRHALVSWKELSRCDCPRTGSNSPPGVAGLSPTNIGPKRSDQRRTVASAASDGAVSAATGRPVDRDQ